MTSTERLQRDFGNYLLWAASKLDDQDERRRSIAAVLNLMEPEVTRPGDSLFDRD